MSFGFLHRHGRTCSGHPSLFMAAVRFISLQDVDTRHKGGHDAVMRGMNGLPQAEATA